MRKICTSIIIISIICGIFYGCEKEGSLVYLRPVFSKTFVRGYVDINIDNYTQYDYLAKENVVRIRFSGTTIRTGASRFSTLSEHYGDTHYNQMVASMPGWNYVLVDEFLSVDIVSDLDFGPEYPAGASLKDIAKFYGTTAYPYVKSGYDDLFMDETYTHYLSNSFVWTGKGYSYVVKLLSELTHEDMTLLGTGAAIQFTQAPPPGNHTFTITYTTNRGKAIIHTLEAEVE